MIKLLMLVMMLAALEQFGMTFSQLVHCDSRACLQQIEKRSRDVLKIDWKHVSVFPEEAKKFR